MFKHKTGFTLIELSIGLAFISILLISITTSTIQLGNSYNRGITMKTVSQAGRSIIADLQSEFRAVEPISAQIQGSDYVLIPNTSNPTGGRLCLGSYSYIWNYATTSKINVNSNYYSDDSNTRIRLVKISDQNKSYCTANPNYPPIPKSSARELLTSGDRDLSLYSFNISNSSYDAWSNSKAFYISFKLGTMSFNSSGVPITSPVDIAALKCKDPGQAGANLAYCVIEEFSVNIVSGY